MLRCQSMLDYDDNDDTADDTVSSEVAELVAMVITATYSFSASIQNG